MGKENPNKENPNEECHGFKVGEYALYEPVMHSDGPELAIMKNGVVPVRVIGFTPIRVRVEIQLDNQRISKKAVNPLSLKKRLTGELVPESTSSGVKVIETDGLVLTIHKIPHTPFTIGYLPKTELPDAKMITTLKKIGAQEKCIFLHL